MTQVWFAYYNVKSLYVKTLTLAMFKILHNIYIDRFLLVAFTKNIFYHRSAAMYFWILSGDCGNCCFLKKIFLKSSHLFIFYPRTSNFHNSRMVGRGKLPDLSMSNIFSVLSIVFIYMTSFWPEVQSCYNNAKRSVLKTQG